MTDGLRQGPNGLQRATDNLKQAQEAIRRALTTCDLNEQLRCIHNASGMLTESHDLIVAWRLDPKGD